MTEQRGVWPVLVVGAGPAGLTTAVSLARQGIDVCVVERRAEGLELPRATVLSVRTMELLRSWGLSQRVLAGGDDVEIVLFELPTAARAAEGRRFDVGYPTPAQSELISPVGPACVAQDHLEEVLLDYLAELPSATIERGAGVIGIEPIAGGSTVRVLLERDGRAQTVEAQYVVAADGARSAVRSAVGIAMVGPEDVLEGVRVEFRAPLWDVLGDHRYGIYSVTEPGGEGVLIPAGQGDRWIFGITAEYGLDLDDMTEDDLRRRVEIGCGVPGLPMLIERHGRFSSAAQLADRFRAGNVFLAGDAAHRVTPRGGTGLNAAIGDGIDLGWKLGWVLRGWAKPGLLDSYEAERRVAVAHHVARSADPMGSRREVGSELDVDLGGRVRHVWVDSSDAASPTGQRRSTVDVLGPGVTILTAAEDFTGEPEEDGSPWRTAGSGLATSPPVDVVNVPRTVARALGIRPGGALVVRPDGLPLAAFYSAANAGADLRHLLSELSGWSAPASAQSESAA